MNSPPNPQSSIGNRQSSIGNRQSAIGNRQSAIANRQSAVENIEIDLLLEAVHQRYGYDFRAYARASVERRVRQFLSNCGCVTVSDLTGRMLRDEELFSRLVQYFSVPVTEMFRDPFVFKALRSHVVPLLRTWPHLRIWCAGCATGEEVYSLAILLREEGLGDRITIYATDFNDANLERARQGVYAADRIQQATENYQRAGGQSSFSEYYHARYDAAAMDGFLKQRITFANHNLVTDKMFAEMHLVVCRNVLIYFNRDLQNRALKLFSESLVRRGFLCLGTKESLQFTDVCGLYETIDQKAKLYRKALI